MPGNVEAKVKVERIRDVFGRPGTPIYAASLILSLIGLETGMLVGFIVGSWRPMLWAVGLIALQASIALFVRAFHREPRSDSDVMAWGRWKVAQETLHGLGWALCIPFIYHHGSLISLVAAMTALVGLVSAAIPGYAVYLPTAIAFASAALLPVAAYLLLMAPPVSYAGVMLAATYLLSIANAVRWSSIYRESIQLRLDLAAGMEERRGLLEAAEQGRRMAEAATAERTRFFGAASHDLRQPVHALGLYASLLRADPPKGERRELIDSIIACVANLEQLFNAILDLSRPADVDSERQSVALNDLITATVLKFRPEAQRRGLSLEAQPTSAWASGDAASIERVLGNLVSNAVRYTQNGGVLIRVRSAGSKVAITVADSGPGISHVDRERIFDPFYRLPRTQTGEGGLGLGLATARELCRSQGYGLSLRSRLKRGSLFRLSLAAAQPVRSRRLNMPEASIASDLNVLLVEDDPRVADAASRLLAAWGVNVHCCADGERALAIVEQNSDLKWHVLLDYRLPGSLNGLSLTEELRGRLGSEFPITLITGEADPSLFAAAKARNLPVLRKPLSPIRLRALLAATSMRA